MISLANQTHNPVVLVDTEKISREAWLSYRRLGVGGSDAAPAIGCSPWKTARDLYYEKALNISAFDEEENWVQLQVGNLLEPLVAKIFEKRTGLKTFQIKKMFVHPVHDFMLADVDYFVEMTDGTTAILEIKTCNYNARNNWWDENGEETIPFHYKLQGLHYMAVMGINRVYFCCLYGNTQDESIIRWVDRDTMAEECLIYCEERFWKQYVQAQIPPPYTESGDLVLKSVQGYYATDFHIEDELALDNTQTGNVQRYLQLQAQLQKNTAEGKAIKSEMDLMKGRILDSMGNHATATLTAGGRKIIINNTLVLSEGIKKAELERLQINYPEVYKQYTTTSQSHRFSVKELKEMEVA